MHNFNKPILLLFLMCYGATMVHSDKCDSSNIMSCIAGMGSLDFKDLDKMCKSLQEMEDCLKNFENSCEIDETQQGSVDQSRQQINSVKSACKVSENSKNGCHSDANACLDPMASMYRNNATASQMCPVMKDSSACLIKLIPKCESEDTKKNVVESADGLVKQGKLYNCTEIGYEITGPGKGVMLQPSISLFLFSTFVMVLNCLLVSLI